MEQVCPHCDVATLKTWLWLGYQKDNISFFMAGTISEGNTTFCIPALSEGVSNDTDLTGFVVLGYLDHQFRKRIYVINKNNISASYY